MLFGLYGELVIFDHVDKTIKVVANADLSAGASADWAYRDACRRIDQIISRLSQPPLSAIGEIDPGAPLSLTYSTNCTAEQFEAMVRQGAGIHSRG